MRDYKIIQINEHGSKGNINPFVVTYINAFNETISLQFSPQFEDKKEYLFFRDKLNNWRKHFIMIRQKPNFEYFLLICNGEKDINLISGLKDYVLNNM